MGVHLYRARGRPHAPAAVLERRVPHVCSRVVVRFVLVGSLKPAHGARPCRRLDSGVADRFAGEKVV